MAVTAVLAAGLGAVVVPAAQAGPPHGAPPAAPPPPAPVVACADLTTGALGLPGTTVTSAVADAGDATTPASCRVTLTVTHPPAGDAVTVWVHLPQSGWNGRFQAMGGGGFSGGSVESLLTPLRNGYATAATDAGHPGATADFALTAEGRLNWPAIQDFGYRGVHDMTVTAKAVIKAFYGTDPQYSYWNGCSTGGRQGLMEAQRYPEDYDGVLAGAPVVNFSRMQIGQMWGQVVMLAEDNPVAPCKFEAALAATIKACDTVGDGVVDGVIGDPLGCSFDLGSLVGTKTPCGDITAGDVEVMRKIAEGPRTQDGQFLWYGQAPGTPYAGLNDVVEQDGRLVGKPFQYDLWWIGLFLAQDRNWDWRTLTYAGFEQFFSQSIEMYTSVLSADDPDLSEFAGHGGKALLWHGAADFGVPFQGTVDYYERVQQTLGEGQTDQFMRLFLAPGVGHCGGGAGPQPTGQFDALVDWVEHGRAPQTLTAEKKDAQGQVVQTRPLCAYPRVAQLTGHRDPAQASSYRCARATELEPAQR
ncbi:tannase/feruloyl esterase family alpha/beta hydrolase [Modestobacter sp. NPDC049651]|uniref:tannase/feruloyl esterase family alpha/beta hydrolase n=1 Tax=unclassified Modestobacter TaxID=2643866 RepID=UPI0033C8F47B